jgi:hypothetical protein
MNNNDLHLRLHELADEMLDTDYTDLRERVDTTTRRIRKRRTAATTVAGIAAVALVAVGGWAAFNRADNGPQPAATPTGTVAGTPTAGPSVATSPSAVTSPSAPAARAVPTAVPGTLVYLDVEAGKPITMTTVTDGVSHETAFGTATRSDGFWLALSPDATRLAAVESPNPDNVVPGDLAIISAGGSRHTIARNVAGMPVWMPDGRHVIATVVGSSAVSTVVDVSTGAATAAPPALANKSYLTWSANGRWLAYGESTDVVVTAADGTGAVKKSVAFRPECQQAGCPTSVQAVSDDGRYVALGYAQNDPGHVTVAYLALDMQTGKLVNLPPAPPGGGINRIWFRPDGGMVVRTVTQNAKYTFILVRADGSTLATFPDDREVQSAGRHLVAYHP